MGKNKKGKIFIGIGIAIIAIYIIIILLSKIFGWEEHFRFYPPCIFYETTGLYCAGCGSGRALTHLLHGELFTAIRMNILPFIVLPIVTIDLIRHYKYKGEKKLISGMWLVVLIILYMILRNLPQFSFLAPL